MIWIAWIDPNQIPLSEMNVIDRLKTPKQMYARAQSFESNALALSKEASIKRISILVVHYSSLKKASKHSLNYWRNSKFCSSELGAKLHVARVYMWIHTVKSLGLMLMDWWKTCIDQAIVTIQRILTRPSRDRSLCMSMFPHVWDLLSTTCVGFFFATFVGAFLGPIPVDWCTKRIDVLATIHSKFMQ